jgi:hypothetical protein
MKTLTWKSMLATLNPSPIFEAVAAFAEELATRRQAGTQARAYRAAPAPRPNPSTGARAPFCRHRNESSHLEGSLCRHESVSSL